MNHCVMAKWKKYGEAFTGHWIVQWQIYKMYNVKCMKKVADETIRNCDFNVTKANSPNFGCAVYICLQTASLFSYRQKDKKWQIHTTHLIYCTFPCFHWNNYSIIMTFLANKKNVGKLQKSIFHHEPTFSFMEHCVKIIIFTPLHKTTSLLFANI